MTIQPRRQPLLAAGSLLALLAACSFITPAPSVRPTPSQPPAGTAAATVSLSPPPSASASASLDLRIRNIPRRFTTPALAYTSDGQALLWSSGAPDARAGAAYLWRYLPGAAEPERIFANPLRDSELAVIGGDGDGHYAFVEQNYEAFPPAGWRLWSLPNPGEAPVLVDEGDVPEGLIPFFAINGDRLVWTVLHETPSGVQSQLWMAGLTGTDPVLLLAADATQIEYLFPSLDGDRLVYSTLTTNAQGNDARADVHLLDLADANPTPLRLNGQTEAFMGVVRGDIVVWQRPTSGSPLNGGRLIRHSLSNGNRREVQLSAEEGVLNYHSVGNRFVAADSELLTRLYIYDLEMDRSVLVEDLGNAPEGFRPAVNVRPWVAGDLLAFVRGSDSADVALTLRWAELPG